MFDGWDDSERDNLGFHYGDEWAACFVKYPQIRSSNVGFFIDDNLQRIVFQHAITGEKMGNFRFHQNQWYTDGNDPNKTLRCDEFSSEFRMVGDDWGLICNYALEKSKYLINFKTKEWLNAENDPRATDILDAYSAVILEPLPHEKSL